MVNSQLEAQRQTIMYYWLNSTCSAMEIHQKTGIPIRTIRYNLKKLEETGTIEHRRGNGRKTKVTQSISRIISQQVCRNNTISTRQLATKMEITQDTTISHSSIWRHMKKNEYKSSVALGTP